MDAVAAPYGRKTQHQPRVAEVHVLWITAGLGCDGDTVSITAASEPSIEDVLLGAIPGLPKVHLHNPVLAYEVGDDFMEPFHQAARGELENFVLVVEGSIPNEKLAATAIGQRSGPIRAPASRSRPRTGSGVWRPRRWPWWEPEPAPPMAASTP